MVSIAFVVFHRFFRNLSMSTVLTFFFMTSFPIIANLGVVSFSSSIFRVTTSFSESESEFHIDASISSMGVSKVQ